MGKAKHERPLTRQRVLEAALRLIDSAGLEGFSMRKLGAALGVEAMALYNHVESKDALFDGIIEILLLQAPYPQRPDVTPYIELWDFAHAYREVLRAHPRALPLVATRPLRTPAALAILERLLTMLHRANVSGIDAMYAVNSLAGFLLGHTLLEVGMVPVAGSGPASPGSPPWQHLPADQYPALHAMTPDLVARGNFDHEFDFGLQALLQSIFARERYPSVMVD